MRKLNIVIVAGESSGDLHASHLVRALPKNYNVTAIGGKYLKEAGVPVIFDLAQYAVAGATEVLRHAFVIRRAFQCIKAHLTETKPDLLILVDYPGFNLWLAKFAKTQLNLKVLYYISPQIWAWKANRIHVIKQYVDHMAVILPFEKAIYEKAQVPCSYVGHPIAQTLTPLASETARRKLKLPLHQPILALLPGSRTQEVKRLLPILVSAVKQLRRRFPELAFVLPVASTLSLPFIRSFIQEEPILLIEQQTQLVMSAADCIVVASGTASLEAALLVKPSCIIYKVSFFSYFLAMKLLRVKFLGLANLIANKMVIPELLQDDCTASHIVETVTAFLKDQTYRTHHIAQLQAIKDSLMATCADVAIEKLVVELTRTPSLRAAGEAIQ